MIKKCIFLDSPRSCATAELKGTNGFAKILFQTTLFISLWVLVFILSNAAAMTISTDTTKNTLSDYEYQHRIIVIQQNEVFPLESVIQLYNENKAGIAERKIKLLVLTKNKVMDVGDEVKESHLKVAELKSRVRDKTLILIGLDGGTKTYYDTLDMKMIFADIDGMPMRRAEMRRR